MLNLYMDKIYSFNKDLEKGQALLLVVLLVTVVLTVSMSLLSRSIINVRLSVEEDQSLKALAAAEAGIEKALISNTTIQNGSLSNNSTFTSTQTSYTGSAFALNNGRLVLKDIGTDIWLSDYSDDPATLYSNPWSGTLSIYWGSPQDVCRQNESTNSMAAIEVIVFSGSKANPNVSRYAFDPCGARRSGGNGNKFSSSLGGGAIAGRTYDNRANIPAINSGLFIRVVPLYANAYVAVQANNSLPSQGILIKSTGKSSEATRTVSVLKENPTLPIEFITYSFLWPK